MAVNMMLMEVTAPWDRSMVEGSLLSICCFWFIFFLFQLKNKYGDAFIRGNNGELSVCHGSVPVD